MATFLTSNIMGQWLAKMMVPFIRLEVIAITMSSMAAPPRTFLYCQTTWDEYQICFGFLTKRFWAILTEGGAVLVPICWSPMIWNPAEANGGVLLFDRYLFSFGFGHPYDFGRSWTTNVYVFDIEERQWLPEPVDGLPNDGTVLPEIQTEQDYPPLHVKPRLFLIGWEQGLPKLALVWASYYTQVCVHCTKFIINPDDTTSSLFKVTILSKGSHKLGNDTTFISCTAPVL